MRIFQPIRLVLIIAGLALLTACSSFNDIKTDLTERVFGREVSDPPEELAEFKQSAEAKVIWQAKVGGAGDFHFTPAVEAGYAYVASSEGDLAKFDISNGNQSWRVSAGEKLSGGVGVGGSLVMVGTQAGVVYAYDISGKLQWKSMLSSEVLS
ncbi:MAG: PQQ-binding-like beta-propeller repeat protein, partial [Methylotenera sp.]